MQKGQLSLDLIFAILVAILFLQVLVGIGESVQESNSVTAVLAQEKRIANEIETFLIEGKVLDVPDATFSASYFIPGIKTPYIAGEQDCTITYSSVGSETIDLNFTITTNDGTIPVSYTHTISSPPMSLTIGPSFLDNCKRTMVISNA